MRQAAAAFMVVSAMILAGCGGGGHEAIVDETISKTKELVSVLEGVTDGPSAEAAKVKVQQIIADMKDIKARAEKLPDPDEATMKRLQEKMTTEMKDVQQKMIPVMMKIMTNPETSKHLKDVLGEMQGL